MIWIILGVLAVVAIAILAWVASTYNGLVTLRNRFKNAFAQIDVQLKRRYDLIPNLVETAKGYMTHERETLDAVITARSRAMAAEVKVAGNPADPAAMKQLMSAEGMLTGALGRLMAVAEAYPNLKADTHMSALMEELTSTENRVAFSRQAYNDSVTSYNTTREQFPAVVIANLLGFLAAELFEIDVPEQREAPKVKFN